MSYEDQITLVKPLVSGDDVLLITTRDIAIKLERVANILTHNVDEPMIKGLGYVLKTFVIHDHYLDFLSKVGWYTMDGSLMTRKINRVVNGGNVSQKDLR